MNELAQPPGSVSPRARAGGRAHGRAAPRRALLAVLAWALCSGAALAGPGDEGLLLLEAASRQYPPEALFQGREADAECTVELDEQGAVRTAQCQHPLRELANAAAQSLSKARFAPRPRSGPGVSEHVTWRWALSRERLEAKVAAPLRWEPAREVLVRGEVLEAGQRAAALGAQVIAQGLGVGAEVDGKGRFTLKLPPGLHTLTTAGAGYFNGQEELEVPAGAREVQVALYLRRKDVSGLSAQVTGEKTLRAPSREVLVREELRNVPGTQGDPVRVLESLPGLSRVAFNGGQLLVRGGDAHDTGAYVDGQRIPRLYHLLQGPSVLGEEMVDRIDFFPGGAGVYYGRNLSGVVAVTTRKGDQERVHGSAAVDLQKSALFLQGPLGSATQWAVGGRLSYVNPMVSLLLPQGMTLAVPVYWDYQGRLDQRLGDHDRVALTLFGSDDKLATVGEPRGGVKSSADQRQQFHRARFVWEHGFSEALSLSLAPSIGWETSSSEALGDTQAARPQTQSGSTLSSGGRAELSWRAAEALEVRLGADVLFDRVRYQQDLLFDQQLRGLGAPNAEQRQLSGLRNFGSVAESLEAEWRLGRLRLTPGLRLEQLHYAGRTFVLLDPRLWARVGAWDSAAFFGYAGLYHQAPQAQEVDAQLGNAALAPLRADQVGVGLEQKLGSDWSFKLEAWRTWRTNLVFPVEASLGADGQVSNPVLLNSGRGEAMGLELLVRKELGGRAYGWIAYTLSRSRQQARAGEAWRPTPFDQPHVLTMLLALRVSPYVEFAARLRLASGNPLAPVEGATLDADSGQYVAARGAFGSARLPAFAQLDFEVNNIWVSDLYNLQLYVDFQNVLARDNSEALLYDYRFQRTAYLRGVPLSAAVGAKVAF